MEEPKATLPAPAAPEPLTALEVTVVDNTSPHTHTIIMLHGFNENGILLRNRILASRDANNMNIKDRFPSVRWIFPTAPIRSPGPSTLRLRAQQARWFDVPNMEKLWQNNKEVQKPGLIKSAQLVWNIIDKEISSRNTGPERIVLGGVCQGAALAVMMMLCFGRTLGGCFAVCGWLPLFGDLSFWRGGELGQEYRAKLAQIQNIVAQNAMHTKLFLMHNKNDEVIPFWNHKALSKLLSDLGMDRVTSAVFEDGSHWFQEPGGMKAIVDFLRMAVGITDDMPEDS